MLKKIVSMLIVFAMLVPVSSAVAADNSDVQPTIEEILNSYHEKAFAASAEGGSEVSAYARRSGSEKTLEQETVDELTAAGYEAYNVTAENYDLLEVFLQTDFASIGLNPEGSYIIVINGEKEYFSAGSNSRALDNLPVYDSIDGGDNSFLYQYGDVFYTMKYYTVVGSATTNSGNAQLSTHSDPSFMETIQSYLNLAFEEFVFSWSSILEWLNIPVPDENSVVSGELFCEANAAWTYKYIMIYDREYEIWRPAGRTEYALVTATLSGTTFDAFTNESSEYSRTKQYYCYASLFNQAETFKEYSAQQFSRGLTFFDKTGNIDILLTGTDGHTTSILTLWEPY